MILFFFFNDTATTEIYTLSLHDALPISDHPAVSCMASQYAGWAIQVDKYFAMGSGPLRAHARVERELFAKLGYAETARRRSEEHTSELQSQSNLVCRLLLEKKKK